MKFLLISLLSFRLFAAGQDPCVIGVGACTIDLLVQVDDSFVQKHTESRRGGGSDCSVEMIDEVLAEAMMIPKIVPGGSAANTIRALSKLGQPTAFLGQVGNDSWGTMFCNNMKAYGVDLRIKESMHTACVLCLISPDGQRTFLGYNPRVEASAPSPEELGGVDWLHVEALHLINRAYVEKTLEMAKERGIKISINLSSYEVVNQHKELLFRLIPTYAEIVFCNEDEVEALTGLDPEAGCLKLQEICPIAVITLGEKGCLVGSHGSQKAIATFPAHVVDTTGAGDYFAAGFIHSYLQHQSLEKCGLMGNRLGSAIVEVIGAELPDERWEQIYLSIKK